MRNILLTSTAALLIATSAMAEEPSPANEKVTKIVSGATLSQIEIKTETRADIRLREMMNATVQVETSDAFGSGTVIYSGPAGVFILTNYHVVADEVAKANGETKTKVVKASSKEKPPTPAPPSTEQPKGPKDPVLKVRQWLILGHGLPAYPLIFSAKFVAGDAKKDLALLRITDTEWRTPFVAKLLPSSDEIEQTESVYAAGGGLGSRPFLTEGMVSLTNIDSVNSHKNGMIMVSSPIIMGNSGGGAYVERDGHYEMIGVPVAVGSASISPLEHMPVAHMAYVIPMRTVRKFFNEISLSELIDVEKAAAN